jgi:peroxiredoxin
MSKLKFWLTLALEVMIAIVIFMALSYYQERDLLDYDQSVANLPIVNLQAFDLQANPVTLKEELKKSDAQMLYFFAPWCQICHLSIENLNDLRALYNKEQLNILIVALDYQSKAEVEQFVAEHELPFTIILGDQSWQSAFKIKGFPTYYLLDANGQITGRSIGYSTALGMLRRASASL